MYLTMFMFKSQSLKSLTPYRNIKSQVPITVPSYAICRRDANFLPTERDCRR